MLLQDILDSAGILSQNEKILLALCVATFPRNSTIVELGTYYGGSASLMLTATKGKAKLFSIDIHQNRLPESLLKHPAFTFFHGTGRKFMDQWEGGADLVFIDGGHSFGSVYDDLLTFSPALREDGIIAFHDVDIRHMGVKIFADTLLLHGNLTNPVKSDSLLIANIAHKIPMPTEDDFAETIINMSHLVGHTGALDPYRQQTDCFQKNPIIVEENKATYFIGKGSRGELVRKFIGLEETLFINSWDANDPKGKYYVCSDQFVNISEFLTNRINVPSRNIIHVSPLSVSTMIKDDILNHECRGILQTVETELEKQILKKAFGSSSSYLIDMMYEKGFLHMFFTQFIFEG